MGSDLDPSGAADGRELASLSPDNKDDVKAYLDWLLDAINKYANQIRRTTVLALFLMAVFIIVAQSGGNITVVGVPISKGSLVLIYIPALVACLFLQLVTDTNRLIALYKRFSIEFANWAGKSPKCDASYSFVMPAFPLMWGASMTMGKSYPNLPKKAQGILMISIDKVTPFIGVVFLGLAYGVLWTQDKLSGLAHFNIVVSMIISIACFVFTIFAYSV